MRQLGTAFALLLLFLFLGTQPVRAATVVKNANTEGGHIVIEKDSTVLTIRTWVDEAACTEGILLLSKPEVRPENIYWTKPVEQLMLPEREKRLIYRYNSLTNLKEIGPYNKGEELVFELIPGTTWCSGHSWLSTNPLHAHISHWSSDCWTASWEDSNDGDFNDVYTEICARPFGGISDKVGIGKDVQYKLPWPAGLAYRANVLPGEKDSEHLRLRGGKIYCCDAVDWDIPRRREVSASFGGTVLWVEDRFDTGYCSGTAAGAANVIVIQTEADVETVYLHLEKGSAKVKIGMQVVQGQILAQAGNSGWVCPYEGGDGSHLHFEWQHHCNRLEVTLPLQGRVGKDGKPLPNTDWYCASYLPNAPFYFWKGGKPLSLKVGGSYTSDNKIP